MPDMDFISFDIRVGLAGITHIGHTRLDFHSSVVNLLRPECKSWTRVGVTDCSPIDHRQIVHDPRCIINIINDPLTVSVSQRASIIDLCLIDFTGNPFVAIREPLLLALGELFVKCCNERLCQHFVLLLPELPGPQSASMNQFSQLTTLIQEDLFSITILANSGRSRYYGSPMMSIPNDQPQYAKLVSDRDDTPSAKLERRCVRRLGHFRTNNPRGRMAYCRFHSYFIHECDEASISLFSEWWRRYGSGSRVILYDLKHNPSLRNAVKAFSDRESITAERIVDTLENRDLGNLIAGIGNCTLVLDVVESGTLAMHYVRKLKEIGIKVNHNMLSAINKAGLTSVKIHDYHIQSFLAKPRDPDSGGCVQCDLGLPLIPESQETATPIRTFDILQMAAWYGWEPEPLPEIPDNVGKGYPCIPKFGKILQQYGDWISYKIFMLLQSGIYPDNWFIIRPDEGDSGSLSDRLQTWFDEKLCVIPVPRHAIKDAQSHVNDWTSVVATAKERHWVEQLESIRYASALILDIFNASGSTATTLAALLKHFNIQPFVYLCMVNFNPGAKTLKGNGIPFYSLYDWYNPRVLKFGSTENARHSATSLS